MSTYAAAPQQEKTTTLGPWPNGINNRQRGFALPEGTFADAVNVDLDNLGYAGRRKGYTKVYSAFDAHSGFSCDAGTFFVETGQLKKLNTDNTATVLCSGLSGSSVSFCFAVGVVYFSDGIVTGKIVGGVAVPWGLPIPSAPTVSQISGIYGAGTYLAALTFVDSVGNESGSCDPVSFTVSSAAGFRFDNLPTAFSKRLYLTDTNGSTLYHVVDVAAATITYSLSAGRYLSGKPLATRFISAPPPGKIVREFKKRLYIADGKVVWYTEPYAYDWVKLSTNFFQFHEPVTVMEPVSGGLWIVSNQTYFYAGTGPDNFQVQPQLNYGAVFGTGLQVPNTNDAMWYSVRGLCYGTQDGQVKNMQEANVAADSGTSGASIVREADGVRQFIASVSGSSPSPLVGGSFLNMDVISGV